MTQNLSTLRLFASVLIGIFVLACGASSPPQTAPPSLATEEAVQPTENIISIDTVSVDTVTLPPVAPPTDTVPPTALPTETQSCASEFSCSDNAGLPALNLSPGGPNDPTFIPCEFPRSEPWVDSSIPYMMELGEHRYFFACEFPGGASSATVTLSDGSARSVQLFNSVPNADLPLGNAVAVVDWPALPFDPTGLYTVTILSNDGNQRQLQFQVDPPTQEHILTVPSAGPPGTVFDVYYVNFDLNTSPTFDFYGEDQPNTGGDHTLLHLGSWQVTINQPLNSLPGKGWAQASLSSASTDRRAAYSITFDSWRVFNLFWLR
jgi:hypothetical protein